MYGVCGEYGGLVSRIPYGMVWYVSKHKHKDNLGTFGSVVERLEVLWTLLNTSPAFWERMGALSRLGDVRGPFRTIYDIRYTIYVLRYTIYDIRYTIYDIRYTKYFYT